MNLTKIAVFSTIAFSSLFLNFSYAAAGNAFSFLNALSDISNGNRLSAYSHLEGLFQNTNDLSDKIRAAYILAFASKKDLKLKSRGQYADFVVKNRTHSTDPLSNDQIDSLLRISGDSYFDDALFQPATESYLGLSKSNNGANQVYARYKLAWIDLNEGHPLSALKRLKFCLDSNISDFALRDAVIRDLGRSWAESAEQATTELKSISNISLSSSDRDRFMEGILLGMRRLQKTDQVSGFRKALFATTFAQAVTQKAVSQGIAVNIESCSVLDWLESPVDT